MKTIQALEACAQYIEVEQLCSIMLASPPPGDTCFRTSIINLENALADTVMGQLACGMCYIATFLVNDKWRNQTLSQDLCLPGFGLRGF